MYQAWNNWALVSIAECKKSFEGTKKKHLKEREMGQLAAISTTRSSSAFWESAKTTTETHL